MIRPNKNDIPECLKFYNGYRKNINPGLIANVISSVEVIDLPPSQLTEMP